jgi:hypothetical protein
MAARNMQLWRSVYWDARLHGVTSHTTAIFRAVAVTAIIIIIIIIIIKGPVRLSCPNSLLVNECRALFSSVVKRSECEVDRSLRLVTRIRMSASITAFRSVACTGTSLTLL